MKRPRPTAVNLDTLTGEAVNLRAVAGDEMMQAALVIVRERLALTPEKLALILLRLVAPDHHVGQTEEAELRGLKPDTLRDYKARGEFARQINGIQMASTANNGGSSGDKRGKNG